MDFSIPVLEPRVLLNYRISTERTLDYFAYAYIFDIWAWIALAILGALFVAFLYLGLKLGAKSEKASFFDTFFLILTRLIQLDTPILGLESRLFLRIASFSLSFLTYMIFVFYTSDLTSRMTVVTPPIAISTVEGKE